MARHMVIDSTEEQEFTVTAATYNPTRPRWEFPNDTFVNEFGEVLGYYSSPGLESNPESLKDDGVSDEDLDLVCLRYGRKRVKIIRFSLKNN